MNPTCKFLIFYDLFYFSKKRKKKSTVLPRFRPLGSIWTPPGFYVSFLSHTIYMAKILKWLKFYYFMLFDHINMKKLITIFFCRNFGQILKNNFGHFKIFWIFWFSEWIYGNLLATAPILKKIPKMVYFERKMGIISFQTIIIAFVLLFYLQNNFSSLGSIWTPPQGFTGVKNAQVPEG